MRCGSGRAEGAPRPGRTRFLMPHVMRQLLRSLADALVLRERLNPSARSGLIGGGSIGPEIAASASTRGCTVTVVELVEIGPAVSRAGPRGRHLRQSMPCTLP